jgi:hypothetical protein
MEPKAKVKKVKDAPAKTKVLIKAPKREKVSRNPKMFDEKYVGYEPIWDTDRALLLEEKELDSLLRQSLNYYNYFYTVKDLKKYLVDWVRSYSDEHEVFDKATVDKFAKTSDNLTPLTACGLVKAHTQGMPLRESHINYLLNIVKRAVGADIIVEEVEDAKPVIVAPKVTIQDRLYDILNEHLTHFENLEEEIIEKKTVEPNAYEYLTAKSVPHAMLGKISAFFNEHRMELQEAKAGTCEQLSEGYSHLKSADFKRFETFYAKLEDGIEQYRTVKKATKKAKVRKPPAKEKLVAKLKYLKIDPVLKLVSINPVDIIGATQLWVFNTKTRKLGRYVADSLGGALGIKGSTIVGFDEVTSLSKTLRKPDVQIKEFMSASKVTIRKYLEGIKSTEIKLTGRIGADTILLKVVV